MTNLKRIEAEISVLMKYCRILDDSVGSLVLGLMDEFFAEVRVVNGIDDNESVTIQGYNFNDHSIIWY